MPDPMEMIGKEVEVIANGMAYRGTLIEVSDTAVHIRSQLQYISLPAGDVTDVRLVAGTSKQWTDTFADASSKMDPTFAVPDEKEKPTFEVPQEEKKDLIP